MKQFFTKHIEFVTGALLVLFVGLLINSSYFSNALKLENPSVNSFNSTIKGYEAIGNGFHEIAFRIPIKQFSFYRVSYNVIESAEKVIVLTSDMIGPGYDNQHQDNINVITQNRIGEKSSHISFSSNSPEAGFLRFFYTGDQGLVLGTPSIEFYSNFYLIVCTIIFCALAISTKYLMLKYPLSIFWSENGTNSLIIFVLILTTMRFMLYLTTPYWSGDEYAYKSIANWIFYNNQSSASFPADVFLVNSNINNKAYPYIASLFFNFGKEFLVVSKAFNAACFGLAAYLICMSIQSVVSRHNLLLLAALILLMPFNAIGSFFVTEPLFSLALALGFCQFFYFRSRGFISALFVGIFTYVLVYIRPNGFIFILGYLVYFSLPSNKTVKDRLKFAFVAIASFLSLKIANGFIDSAPPDVYSNILTSVFFGTNQKFTVDAIIGLLVGHLYTLSFVYLMPIIVIVHYLYSNNFKETLRYELAKFSIALFVSGFVVSIAFTIIVSGSDLGGLGRWHMRYYFYTLPMVLAAFFMVISDSNYKPSKLPFVVWLIVSLFVLSYSSYSGITSNQWFGSAVDNIDGQWLQVFPLPFIAIVGFYFIIFYIYNKNLGASFLRSYAYIAICLFLLSNIATRHVHGSTESVTKAVNRLSGVPYSFFSTQCGDFASDFFGTYPGTYSVIAPDLPSIISVNYWLTSLPKSSIILPESSKISNHQQIASSKTRYLILNGQYDTSNYITKASLGACSILEIKPNIP